MTEPPTAKGDLNGALPRWSRTSRPTDLRHSRPSRHGVRTMPMTSNAAHSAENVVSGKLFPPHRMPRLP